MCNYYTILDKNLKTRKINFFLTLLNQTILAYAMLHYAVKFEVKILVGSGDHLGRFKVFQMHRIKSVKFARTV